jgi:hypothetical protein
MPSDEDGQPTTGTARAGASLSAANLEMGGIQHEK